MNHGWSNFIRHHVALATQYRCVVLMGQLPV
jgi:hypothetical protein